MVRQYTFRDLVILYIRTEEMHRMAVSNQIRPPFKDDLNIEAGPMASLDTVLSYQKEGRYFVGQALTEDLPYVFELVPAKETTLEMIVLTNDNNMTN